MEIKLKEIPIRDVVEGYVDNDEEGVLGYGGKLNIRPKYQREFVYKDKQREEVINTINNDFPLNVMYWMKNDDGTFEVLDGQQRTISFCQYVKGDFSLDYKYFHTLTKTEQDKILDYKLMIYFCEGTDIERLEWFEIINIAGEKLTDQELKNAIYTGEWLTDAKRHFSKSNCAAYGLASDYMSGSPIRQDYLETVLKWISSRENMVIKAYMAKHQKDTNASELWLYFQNVINWVKTIFPNYRKEMKGIEWGYLYNEYSDLKLDPKQLESEIERLMMDEDVTSKKGVYEYLLSGNEKHLNIRAFSDNQKREAYERQKGVCPMCKDNFELAEMHADHITPWSKGGKTSSENCQMLCRDDNLKKGNI